MAIPAKQMEVERLMNLAKAFGWELVNQSFGASDVTMTIKKKFSAESVEAAAGGGPSVGPS